MYSSFGVFFKYVCMCVSVSQSIMCGSLHSLWVYSSQFVGEIWSECDCTQTIMCGSHCQGSGV